MKNSQALAAVLTIGMFGYVASTDAQSVLTTDTLADLMATGGSLGIDDKIFSGFNYIASGLTSFNPAAIIVTASEDANGVDYLTWGGNISLAAANVTTADLKLNYIVTANPGLIAMIDQSYTGSAQNGFLAVDETVATGAFGGPILAQSNLTATYNTDPPLNTVPGPNLFVNPAQPVLYVTKDIGLAVTSASGGFITISQVSQSFHQIAVPEPSSFGLLFSGLGCLSWIYRARRQKNI